MYMGQKDTKVFSKGLSDPDYWMSTVEVSSSKSVLQKEMQARAV